MTLLHWGRIFLVGGAAGTLLAVLPAVVLSLLPPVWSDGFVGVLAALLTLTVAPLGIAALSVGAILLLLGAGRRDRS